MNPTTNKQEPLGGEKCDCAKYGKDCKSLDGQQAGAAGASEITDAQITAGSNVLCDCPEPKRIGRNAAIDVFEAMTKAASAHADTGAAGAGESIDTPEFRNLLCDMLDAYRKELQGGPALPYEKARPKFIAHIDAQLARKRQDSAPTDLSKRLRNEAAEAKDSQNRFAGSLLAAADEIERLSAAAAPVQGEPVAWEYRHYDTANEPHKWTEWERVEPRNRYTETAADRVAEIQAYIDQGYKYELRALYLGPAAQADEVRDAARWRAFVGSARIRPLGNAGLNKPEPNHYAHMGLEIWTRFGRDYSPELIQQLDRENEIGRDWLTKYADIAIEAQRTTAADNQKG